MCSLRRCGRSVLQIHGVSYWRLSIFDWHYVKIGPGLDMQTPSRRCPPPTPKYALSASPSLDTRGTFAPSSKQGPVCTHAAVHQPPEKHSRQAQPSPLELPELASAASVAPGSLRTPAWLRQRCPKRKGPKTVPGPKPGQLLLIISKDSLF